MQTHDTQTVYKLHQGIKVMSTLYETKRRKGGWAKVEAVDCLSDDHVEMEGEDTNHL